MSDMLQIMHDTAKQRFLEHYDRTYGNISLSCKSVNVARTTFYYWRDSDPEFKAKLDQINPREKLKDFYENALIKKVRQGDTACTIFANKSFNKDRGYVERAELTLRSEEPIDVELRIDRGLLTNGREESIQDAEFTIEPPQD
jgi:ribosome biogenesis GTPase A